MLSTRFWLLLLPCAFGLAACAPADPTLPRVFDTADGLPGDDVRAIARSASGDLWVGTRSGAAFSVDGEEFEPLDLGEADPGVASLLAAQDGSVWIGGPFGIHERAAHGSGVTHYFGGALALDANVAFSLHQASDGSIWTGTSNGAARFDGTAWTSLTPADGLPAPVVHDVVSESSDVVWFAFRDAGVARRDASGWTRHLESRNARKLFLARDGRLWVGTSAAGVYVFDGASWTQHHDGSTLLPWAEDAQGRIWFSDEGGGVRHFDGQSWTTLGTADGLPSTSVHVVFIDDDGTVWAGTDQGLVRLGAGTH